jgi:hypothetical protein
VANHAYEELIDEMLEWGISFEVAQGLAPFLHRLRCNEDGFRDRLIQSEPAFAEKLGLLQRQ